MENYEAMPSATAIFLKNMNQTLPLVGLEAKPGDGEFEISIFDKEKGGEPLITKKIVINDKHPNCEFGATIPLSNGNSCSFYYSYSGGKPFNHNIEVGEYRLKVMQPSEITKISLDKATSEGLVLNSITYQVEDPIEVVTYYMTDGKRLKDLSRYSNEETSEVFAHNMEQADVDDPKTVGRFDCSYHLGSDNNSITYTNNGSSINIPVQDSEISSKFADQLFAWERSKTFIKSLEDSYEKVFPGVCNYIATTYPDAYKSAHPLEPAEPLYSSMFDNTLRQECNVDENGFVKPNNLPQP